MTTTTFTTGKIIWLGEPKTAKNGQPFINAMVAGYHESDPVISVLAFGGPVDQLQKGDRIAAEGRLSADVYTNKDGETVPSLTIMSDWWKPLGKRATRTSGEARASGASQSNQQQVPGTGAEPQGQHPDAPTGDAPDDIPF